MAMTFRQMITSVQTHIGDASGRTEIDIKRWINDARNILWEQIPGNYKEAEDYLVTTADYSSDATTTVTVTNGDATVTSDGADDTVFTAAMVGRYIQLNSTDPWYQIASLTSATSIELADAYIGDTDTAASFTVRTHHWPLSSAVQRLVSVRPEDTAIHSDLEIYDRSTIYRHIAFPERFTSGPPTLCWLDEPTSANLLQLGLYPVPASAILVRYRYESAVTELSADSDTMVIPGGDAAILARALWNAFTFKARLAEAGMYMQNYEVERDRLRASVKRTTRTSFPRRDPTDASGIFREVNLGGNFPVFRR